MCIDYVFFWYVLSICAKFMCIVFATLPLLLPLILLWLVHCLHFTPARISLCMDNQLPIVVFDLGVAGNVLKVVTGEKVGTRVDLEEEGK